MSTRLVLTSASKCPVSIPMMLKRWDAASGIIQLSMTHHNLSLLRLYGIGKVRDRLIGEAFLHFSDVQLLQQKQLTG